MGKPGVLWIFLVISCIDMLHNPFAEEICLLTENFRLEIV